MARPSTRLTDLETEAVCAALGEMLAGTPDASEQIGALWTSAHEKLCRRLEDKPSRVFRYDWEEEEARDRRKSNG